MSTKKENTAMTVQNTDPSRAGGFMTLANTDSQMMTAELDGLDLQFERIKIPLGGGIVFEVPGEEEEPDTVKEFSAVILYHHPLNAYYQTRYNGGSNPPDCGSYDGNTGTGTPGGSCKTCPLNQYGSAPPDNAGEENGKGKACKNRRRMYLLREGEIFPMLLSLPTGSLKSFTKYLQMQLSKGRQSNTIVTKFSLKKAVSKSGISYSQCIFTLDRILTPDEQKAVQKVTEQVKSYAGKVGYETDSDYGDIVVNPETGEVIEPLGGDH